jgi:plastocyanin
VAVLAVLAVTALAACGGSGGSDGGGSGATTSSSPPSASPGGGSAGAAEISIQDFSFTPSETTVAAGTTVTWTNDDTADHDVTSTDGPGVDAATTSTFASETLSQGDAFSYAFNEPGTYFYECTIHASMATMHATIIVE